MAKQLVDYLRFHQERMENLLEKVLAGDYDATEEFLSSFSRIPRGLNAREKQESTDDFFWKVTCRFSELSRARTMDRLISEFEATQRSQKSSKLNQGSANKGRAATADRRRRAAGAFASILSEEEPEIDQELIYLRQLLKGELKPISIKTLKKSFKQINKKIERTISPKNVLKYYPKIRRSNEEMLVYHAAECVNNPKRNAHIKYLHTSCLIHTIEFLCYPDILPELTELKHIEESLRRQKDITDFHSRLINWKVQNDKLLAFCEREIKSSEVPQLSREVLERLVGKVLLRP